jgi:polyisoprenyl-teichoic acid--peptidoglycan teichoic acid transferase
MTGPGHRKGPPRRRAARVSRLSRSARAAQAGRAHLARRVRRTGHSIASRGAARPRRGSLAGIGPPGRRPRPRRVRFHRARTLAGTLGLTALGTFIPGSGILLAGRRGLGLALLAVTGLLGIGVVYAATHRSELISAAVDTDKLMIASVASFVVVLGTIGVGVLTYLMVRRRQAPERDRAIEIGFVVVLCLVVAAPFAVGARFAYVQRDLVNSVFAKGGEPAESETHVWGPDDRVNVLLLGGDAGVGRIGVRTDSVMLASLDADTGETVLFSMPRNLAEVPFPPGSELAEAYPDGFDGPGDPLEWMLNAVYGNVPAQHPELFRGVANPGAEAVKQAVSGALGIPVDYYALINLRGFREVVDAIGGVTVNINQPIPIGGNTDRGVPPRDYLDPGPSQHLNGFEALWFARGRYGLDDYNRMARQRCVMDALIEEADPVTLLRRYEALASAGKKIVRTDIPQGLVPSFVQLGLDLRDGDVHSVVFKLTNAFNPNDPDYHWMHRKVQRTLEEAFGSEQAPAPKAPTQTGSAPASGGGDTAAPAASPAEPTASPQAEEPASDPCAYHPVS